jgi:predicted small secreted protein
MRFGRRRVPKKELSSKIHVAGRSVIGTRSRFSRGASAMSTLRRSAVLTLIAGLGFLLGACEHTIRGAGQDIQETGEAVEDTVEGNP